MSECTISMIQDRVKHAAPSSPIAVFECGRREFLNAVFADTIQSRKWVSSGKDWFGYELIGVWHQYSDTEKMIEILKEHYGN